MGWGIVLYLFFTSLSRLQDDGYTPFLICVQRYSAVDFMQKNVQTHLMERNTAMETMFTTAVEIFLNKLNIHCCISCPAPSSPSLLFFDHTHNWILRKVYSTCELSPLLQMRWVTSLTLSLINSSMSMISQGSPVPILMTENTVVPEGKRRCISWPLRQTLLSRYSRQFSATSPT